MKKLTPKGKIIVEIIILAIAVALTYIFWDSFIVYPIKLFVILLHESAHCLAALVTGGTVTEIKINYELGGSCSVKGGSPFLIAISGYLGSLLFGGVLFISGKYYKFSRYFCDFLALLLIVISIFFIKSPFGLFFTICFTTILLLSPRILNKTLHSYLMKILGIISCFYVIADIKDDLFTLDYHHSDAQILAELTGTHALLWGAIIFIISIIFFYSILRFNFKKV